MLFLVDIVGQHTHVHSVGETHSKGADSDTSSGLPRWQEDYCCHWRLAKEHLISTGA